MKNLVGVEGLILPFLGSSQFFGKQNIIGNYILQENKSSACIGLEIRVMNSQYVKSLNFSFGSLRLENC
jgi:hypothetical protein